MHIFTFTAQAEGPLMIMKAHYRKKNFSWTTLRLLELSSSTTDKKDFYFTSSSFLSLSCRVFLPLPPLSRTNDEEEKSFKKTDKFIYCPYSYLGTPKCTTPTPKPIIRQQESEELTDPIGNFPPITGNLTPKYAGQNLLTTLFDIQKGKY